MKYNIKCPAVQAAYVDSRNPNTHYSGADQIVSSEYQIAYIKFDLSPLAPYKKKSLINAKICFYNRSTRADRDFWIETVNSPIDYASITYNTAPTMDLNIRFEADEESSVYPDYSANTIKKGNVKFIPYDSDYFRRFAKFLNSDGDLVLQSYNGVVNPEDSYYNTPLIMRGIDSGSLYLEIDFEDFDHCYVSDRSPANNIFINPILSQQFSFYVVSTTNTYDYYQYYFLSPVSIQSVILTATNITDSGTQQITINPTNSFLTDSFQDYTSFNVPANTFLPNKNYEWKASIITEIGSVPISPFGPSTFNTIDATPSAPRIISPQSQYLDGEQPIILQWQHNISTGSTQYAYDIDYLQTGSWTNLVNHAVSSAQTYTIPANTLAAGNFQWRVRTYNTSNVAGPYATSERNTVDVPPQPPVIRSINAVPRLSVSWQATGQEAFNVTITDASGNTVINSGNVYGVQKEYEIGTYLPDGSYTVSVKIQNAQGEWSNAVTSGVNIQNNPIGVDEIQATPIRNGVSLRTGPPPADYGAYVGETVLQSPGKYLTDKIGTTETTPEGTHYILRDGEPIAKLDGNSFIDYTSVGPHEYRLRVTYADGTYYDSLPVTAAPILPYATIAFLDDPGTLFVLKYQRDARPTTEKQISETLVSHAFLGRDLPVYDATGQKSIQWDFAYTLLHNLDGAAPFFAQQKTVIVRDPKGERAIGLIQSHNLTFRRQFRELTFSVAGNDATEVIPYD